VRASVEPPPPPALPAGREEGRFPTPRQRLAGGGIRFVFAVLCCGRPCPCRDMSFWRSAAASSQNAIDEQLHKPDCSLDALLNEPELIQELKALNSRLIDLCVTLRLLHAHAARARRGERLHQRACKRAEARARVFKGCWSVSSSALCQPRRPVSRLALLCAQPEKPPKHRKACQARLSPAAACACLASTGSWPGAARCAQHWAAALAVPRFHIFRQPLAHSPPRTLAGC
jgi:hypothetical protein